MILEDIIKITTGEIKHNDLILLDTSVSLLINVENLKEDLLLIEYGNILFDVGWYPSFNKNGCFQLQIINDNDWMNPLNKIECSNWEEFFKALKTSLIKANKLDNS